MLLLFFGLVHFSWVYLLLVSPSPSLAPCLSLSIPLLSLSCSLRLPVPPPHVSTSVIFSLSPPSDALAQPFSPSLVTYLYIPTSTPVTPSPCPSPFLSLSLYISLPLLLPLLDAHTRTYIRAHPGSNGRRDGRVGGVFGVPAGLRRVAVGVRLALQGEDAAQPADDGGGTHQKEATALSGQTTARSRD